VVSSFQILHQNSIVTSHLSNACYMSRALFLDLIALVTFGEGQNYEVPHPPAFSILLLGPKILQCTLFPKILNLLLPGRKYRFHIHIKLQVKLQQWTLFLCFIIGKQIHASLMHTISMAVLIRPTRQTRTERRVSRRSALTPASAQCSERRVCSLFFFIPS
jgi:hypothetical protein